MGVWSGRLWDVCWLLGVNSRNNVFVEPGARRGEWRQVGESQAGRAWEIREKILAAGECNQENRDDSINGKFDLALIGPICSKELSHQFLKTSKRVRRINWEKDKAASHSLANSSNGIFFKIATSQRFGCWYYRKWKWYAFVLILLIKNADFDEKVQGLRRTEIIAAADQRHLKIDKVRYCKICLIMIDATIWSLIFSFD